MQVNNKYSYFAKNKEGLTFAGEILAHSAVEAAKNIVAANLVPIKIKRKFFTLPITNNKISYDLKIDFFTNLGFYLAADFSLLDALDLSFAGSRSPYLRSMGKDLNNKIQNGLSFSEAIKIYPQVFDNLSCQLIKIGEKTGNLSKMSLKIAQILENQAQLNKKINDQLFYPVMVLVAIFGAIFIANFFILPNYLELFANFDAVLPWQTKLLLISLDIILGISTIGLGIFLFCKYKQNVWNIAKFKFQISYYKDLYLKTCEQRLLYGMSVLLKSDIDLIEAFKISAKLVDNIYFQEQVNKIILNFEAGLGLSEAIKATNFFSWQFIQLFKNAQQTGQLVTSLNNGEILLNKQIEHELARLVKLIQPSLLILLTLFVLFLALGILLPIWDLTALTFSEFKAN